MLTTVDQRLGEILGEEEGPAPVRFPENYRSLDVIRDVYLGKATVPPSQLKAAVAALKHEFPQLAVVAQVRNDGLGERLEKALEAKRALDAARSEGRVMEMIGRPVSEPLPESEAAQPFVTTASMRNRKGQ